MTDPAPAPAPAPADPAPPAAGELTPVMVVQLVVSLLVMAFLAAAFWFGKLDSITALSLFISFAALWLPSPLQIVAIRPQGVEPLRKA